jgi:hypothetical protein
VVTHRDVVVTIPSLNRPLSPSSLTVSQEQRPKQA